MKNLLIGICVVGALLILFSGYKILTNKKAAPIITSYQECVDAGYPILESYPEQCKTPDGKTFVNPNATPPVIETPPDEDTTIEPPTGTTSKAALAAKTALAKELKIDEKIVTVVELKATTWSDGCLGLGGPEESCLQALVPGYKVTLSHQTTTYIYRTNTDGTVVRKEK